MHLATPQHRQDGMKSASLFEVLPATPADIDDMTRILISAMEYEIVIRFMFGPCHHESVRLQTEFFNSLWKKEFQNNAAHIMKATLNSTGEIVGFGLVRWADGKWEKPETPPKTRPGREERFLDFYGAEEDRNYRQLMAGKEHYVWGSLYVLPEYQRKGIGSAILRWGFERYALEKETVFIQTFMGAQGMYARYGWEVVDATVIDLAEWGGELRGFGLHRSPQMIRQPGPFK
ncbi:acyl-CoA N-acyltransferase [Halenospora varia]|nr:acyl-CoA N-acyltransferase [Halenospora varia]